MSGRGDVIESSSSIRVFPLLGVMSVVSYVVLRSLIGVVQGAVTLVKEVLVILKHERLWVAAGLVRVKLTVLGRCKN